jgi:hypothetical protein
VTLADIDYIELLRKAALKLQVDNKKLTKLLAQLKRELQALEGGHPEQLKLQIVDLEQQLAKRKDLLFGDKTENRGSLRAGQGREAGADRTRATLATAAARAQAGHLPAAFSLLAAAEAAALDAVA